jgi:hypothetical protein
VPEHIPSSPRVRALWMAVVLTQRELVQRAGVVPDRFNRVEYAPPDADLPRPCTIRKLANAVQLSPQSLVAPEVAP